MSKCRGRLLLRLNEKGNTLDHVWGMWGNRYIQPYRIRFGGIPALDTNKRFPLVIGN